MGIPATVHTATTTTTLSKQTTTLLNKSPLLTPAPGRTLTQTTTAPSGTGATLAAAHGSHRSIFSESYAVTGGGTDDFSYKQDGVVGYSPKQMYNIVVDVDRYIDFLPWVTESRVIRRPKLLLTKEWARARSDHMTAKLSVGFGPLSAGYVSNIKLMPYRKVLVDVPPGDLFEYLHTVWEFQEVEHSPYACNLLFSCTYKMNSPLYAAVAGNFFQEVSDKTRDAFIKRAGELYGAPIQGKMTSKIPSPL